MTPAARLVVIGNGMAGARFVEEIVTRGGPDRFAVTVFGDEPVGNYNRILLSSVLAGSHQPRDIFINPLPWYAEHGVTLHAGARVTAIDLEQKQVSAGSDLVEPYDVLVMATGSRGFVPPMDGREHRRRHVQGRVCSSFARSTTATGSWRAAPRHARRW